MMQELRLNAPTNATTNIDFRIFISLNIKFPAYKAEASHDLLPHDYPL